MKNNRFLYALVVLTMGLYLALDGAYQPAALNSKSVKFIATEIEKVAPESEGTMYEFIEESLHAAGDPVHYFEINFYLNNRPFLLISHFIYFLSDKEMINI